jgi:hypothetical protein
VMEAPGWSDLMPGPPGLWKEMELGS